jgi:hypothetical protein
LVNGTSFDSGLVQEAFRFDASLDQGVNVGVIEPGENFTLEAWVKPFSFPNAAPSVLRSDFNMFGGARYLLALTSDSEVHCNIGFNVGGNPAGGHVPLNAWSHVACTYDGTITRAYVDGVEVAAAVRTGTRQCCARDLFMGREEMFTDRNFDGLIDEARVYDRVLSPCELQAIVQARLMGVCKGDADGDGVQDYQDNCRGTMNPGQENADGDAAGDPCDCAPSDPTGFATPGEVGGFQIGSGGDESNLEWFCSASVTAGSATLYDVPRGALHEFPVGAGSFETCVTPGGVSIPTATDLDTPEIGEGFWYLVRGRNACGVGTYGFRSNGIERVTTVCP